MSEESPGVKWLSGDPQTLAEHAADMRPSLLIVDDERNILSALRRLFAPTGCIIHLAESGQHGLKILQETRVDLIISDMRMPEMDGATFLCEAARRWPDTVRILLTGYADLSSTISAVNRGGIYRYISKPWEESDLRLTVQQALERKFLEREKAALQQVVTEQHQVLIGLNHRLEDKVRERTRELQEASGMLEKSYESLRRSYASAIRVFSNMIELREGRRGGHARRVGRHAERLARCCGLSDTLVQDIVFAALLHDVGKIGLPDQVLLQPFEALDPKDLEAVKLHPIVGQTITAGLEPLQKASLLIRHHHELYDGSGFPDGLAGAAIPLGARILALANDYDALQNGMLQAAALSPGDARQYLSAHAGRRYDPALVEMYLSLLSEEQQSQSSRMVGSAMALTPGMTLAADVLDKRGLLLLTEGSVLDDRLIDMLRRYEKSVNYRLSIATR